MKKERNNLGFSDLLNDFNSSEWSPKKKEVKSNISNQQRDKLLTVEAAEISGFQSREPQSYSKTVKTQQRRRRTGRNAQFNLKAKPETIRDFCDIADQNGWGLGETLEYAVQLLKNTYMDK